MSFCAEVKRELLSVESEKRQECCDVAEVAGIIRIYGRLSALSNIQGIDGENVAKIQIVLRKIDVLHAARMKKLINEKYPDVEFKIKALKEKGFFSEEYRNVEILVQADSLLCNDMGLACIGDEIYYERFYLKTLKACCIKAYLAGGFLISGSVNDPKKSYHLSITFNDYMVCEEAAEMMQRFDLKPKISEKAGKPIVYFKDSQNISDFLKVLGTGMAVLKFENAFVSKDVINRTNRAVNCDSANLDRVISTGAMQAEKIKILIGTGKFKELPENLQEIGRLRIENPEVSLSDLGDMLVEPIGKSGVNHRLRKLMEIAERQ